MKSNSFSTSFTTVMHSENLKLESKVLDLLFELARRLWDDLRLFHCLLANVLGYISSFSTCQRIYLS